MVPRIMEETTSISRDGFPSSEAQYDVPLAPKLPSPKTGSPSPSLELESKPPTDEFDQLSLEEALDALSLDDRKSDRMFRALATIFRASQLQESRITFDALQGEDVYTLLQQADVAENRGIQDAAPLISVKNVLDQLLWFHSQLLLPALTIVADASRDGKSLWSNILAAKEDANTDKILESWRIPFGQAGLVDLALNVVATQNMGNDLLVHALRLVGNSCADTGNSDSKSYARQSSP